MFANKIYWRIAKFRDNCVLPGSNPSKNPENNGHLAPLNSINETTVFPCYSAFVSSHAMYRWGGFLWTDPKVWCTSNFFLKHWLNMTHGLIISWKKIKINPWHQASTWGSLFESSSFKTNVFSVYFWWNRLTLGLSCVYMDALLGLQNNFPWHFMDWLPSPSCTES